MSVYETSPDGINPEDDVLSTVTEAVLRDAIGGAGGMLTGFLGLVTFMDEEGRRYYRLLAGTEQNTITSLGMQRMMTHLVEDQLLD
jgi:hypothetical protein